MLDFAAIDFETANGKRSSVCSVGIVVVRNGEVAHRYHSFVRPTPNFYSWFTTQIHGMTYHDTVNERQFPEVWQEIMPLIDGLPLVAHNSSFDEGCLRAVFHDYGLAYPEYSFYCTCRAAKRAYPELPNHKLNTVSAYCGYTLENHHHALADAEACAVIALNIL